MLTIKTKETKVRDIFNGYINSGCFGAVGCGGKLTLLPKNSIEISYGEKEREAIIDSILKDYPISTMKWIHSGYGKLSVMDGRKRLMSICDYINGDFYTEQYGYFFKLPEEKKNKILDCRITTYLLEHGNYSEYMEYFERTKESNGISRQEFRNLVFAGKFVDDVKRFFVGENCEAKEIGGKYLSNESNSLEQVLEWASNGNIGEYMELHKKDKDASCLIDYFKNVISWVVSTFPTYRKNMDEIEWGILFNKYGNTNFEWIDELAGRMMDDDMVTDKSGIYEYLLNGDEELLKLAKFSKETIRGAIEKQNGKCAKCGNEISQSKCSARRIKSYKEGGRNDIDNCEVLCKECLSGDYCKSPVA